MAAPRILIVEDEGIEALDIQRRLTSLGYPTPDIVMSGEDAVKKVEESCPDLVLMDIMLSGAIDGVTAAEQIHTRFDVPVIYLTAYTDDVTLKRARITEPYGYIVKPFKEREVHITIDMALYKYKMERALKDSEKWFSTTLRSIGDAVISVDKNGLITFMNPVAENLIGWRQEEVLNHRLAEVFNILNSQTRQPVDSPVTRAILEGTITGLANHTVLVARDGREIPIDQSAAPIKDDKGNIIGAILVFHDVTEREKAEEALRRSNDELERRVAQRTADLAATNDNLKFEIEQRRWAEHRLRANNNELENARTAKDRFLKTMVHELHMVLDANMGSTSTFMSGLPAALTEAQEKPLGMIRSSAQHLRALIYYLLDLAKIESGNVALSTEPVDLSSIITEVMQSMRPAAEQKGLQFTCNMPEAQVLARTHRRALGQILLNLTDNAVKFTERGQVHLDLVQRNEYGRSTTEISVVDTGIGIRKKDQEAIFKGFEPEGIMLPRTGLGLHLSQKLAELIGAELSLRSVYGKGSTFTLTLKPPFMGDLSLLSLGAEKKN
ncbi:MAG: PAS domain S-box protein [Chloroflexi bacterium]|nr:PAS domain S-box protein [Chloroflexota bacterium]